MGCRIRKDPDFDLRFSQFMRAKREAGKIRMQAMADHMGVSYNTLSIRCNQDYSWSIQDLVDLADFFKTTAPALLDEFLQYNQQQLAQERQP
jgi:hypothetical protein